jgi:hypothetical protein
MLKNNTAALPLGRSVAENDKKIMSAVLSLSNPFRLNTALF